MHFMACIDHTVSRETFNIVECESCGFKYTNPRPETQRLGRYYKSEDYIFPIQIPKKGLSIPPTNRFENIHY